MVKHFALVMDGQVLNVWRNRADTETAADVSPVNAARMVECQSDVSAGWLYDGANFTAPPTISENWQDRRRKAYLEELRDRAQEDELAVIGKILDVLLMQVEAMRVAGGFSMTPKYAALRTKIAEIKARYPEA